MRYILRLFKLFCTTVKLAHFWYVKIKAMETILEWQSPEHHFDRKSVDWYWALGIIVLGGVILSFYFGNFLFAIFLLIAGIVVGALSYQETKSVPVKITTKGIAFGRRLYPWLSIRSFWIEDEHIHGPRILLHPTSHYLPLIVIPVNEEIDLNDVHDILLEFIDEEFLRESIFHKWLDKIIAR